MGTETRQSMKEDIYITLKKVKLNNPQMGTETSVTNVSTFQ